MNKRIAEMYEEGKELSEIIVELNTTHKHVMKVINSIKRKQRAEE